MKFEEIGSHLSDDQAAFHQKKIAPTYKLDKICWQGQWVARNFTPMTRHSYINFNLFFKHLHLSHIILID